MGKRFRGCESKCVKCFLFQVKKEGKVTVAEGPIYTKASPGVRDRTMNLQAYGTPVWLEHGLGDGGI